MIIFNSSDAKIDFPVFGGDNIVIDKDEVVEVCNEGHAKQLLDRYPFLSVMDKHPIQKMEEIAEEELKEEKPKRRRRKKEEVVEEEKIEETKSEEETEEEKKEESNS